MLELLLSVNLHHHLYASIIFIIRSSSPKEAFFVLALAKKASSTSLKIKTMCKFYAMKNTVELNRLLLKLLLLREVDIQEYQVFCEENAKFNSLGIIWESKRSWRGHFQVFREPKLQHFGNHVASSEIYWVHYKPPVLSYSEVGTYEVDHLVEFSREKYNFNYKSHIYKSNTLT